MNKFFLSAFIFLFFSGFLFGCQIGSMQDQNSMDPSILSQNSNNKAEENSYSALPRIPLAIEKQDGQTIDFTIEVASTKEEKEQGLMFREKLGEKEGMLFLFDTEKPLTFWMKNTFIPLDIIFINENLEIVDIATNFPPCETENCIIYQSNKPAQYALEINGGLAEKLGIKVNDKIRFTLQY